MVRWIVVMKIQPAFALMIEENHEKTPVRMVGTGVWTRVLLNASLVRYYGATSLGYKNGGINPQKKINKRYEYTAHTFSRLLSDILIWEKCISISIRFQMTN